VSAVDAAGRLWDGDGEPCGFTAAATSTATAATTATTATTAATTTSE
jgi:hypothetical protein